jgi:hypothetical protein
LLTKIKVEAKSSKSGDKKVKTNISFQKIHPKGSLVSFQGIIMVYLIQKTCVCRHRASRSDTGRFSYNYTISNLPQKDLIPVIFLDSARLYGLTPHGFVLYQPKDPLSMV